MIDRIPNNGHVHAGSGGHPANNDLTTLQELEATLHKLEGEKEKLEEKIQQAIQQAKAKLHDKNAIKDLDQGAHNVSQAQSPAEIIAQAMAAVNSAQDHVRH